ncbi:MAG: type I DNA topoisomerase [Phycisphaerae bacterium]|nr:type I DNA topoisomerase [Phycisphaerae bacterium]
MAKAAKKTVKKTAKKKTSRAKSPAAAGAGKKSPAAAGAGKMLVIVESPAKAKTINKYLGPDFIVKASMGHVRDLPSRNPKGVKAPVPGVDIEHNFAPTYEPLPRGKKTLTELRKYAKDAPLVFLATDLDREGEAIAWHLAEGLKLDPERTQRVIFNEITKSAIKAAFDNPRKIDMDMVNAQQARRILDRIVGYQVSPLLWKKVAGGLSAGRVQSVAVRLIVDREAEIDAFMPEEFWRIDGVFTADVSRTADLSAKWREFLAQRDEKDHGPTKARQHAWLAEHGAFIAELAKVDGKRFKVGDADAALAVAKALGVVVDDEVRETVKAKGPAANRLTVVSHVGDEGPELVVDSLNHRDTKRKPYAPFTTATLQQTASSQLRFTARNIMRIAQQLYEGINIPGEEQVGLITYMRTDSRNLSREAVASVREMIGKDYGPAYVPEKPNIYSSSDRAQEAHEAIRPTDCRRHPDDLQNCLTPEQHKLYTLIWQRFVSCQMSPAVWKVTEADIVAETTAGKATFRAIGRTLGFDGYLRVMGISHHEGDQLLPELQEGKPVGPVSIDPRQHFTQPPPRFTEASLVKALEADNIGRPSTYAAIIQTIQDRKYVERQQRNFRPTDLGTVVTQKLLEGFPKLFEIRFTAHMEDELDLVEEAKHDWIAVLRDFYGPFKTQLEQAGENMVHAKAETRPSEYECPDCGAPMEYRFGKNGKFLSCTKYPECKKAMPIDRDGKPMAEQHTDIACPLCGKAMNLRKGRFGPFLSCADYPDCKGVVNIDNKGFVKHPSAPPLGIEMDCNKCDSKTMNLRRSKRGPWLSCSRYPKCRGRAAWKGLDEETQKKLELDLMNHENANPQPRIKNLQGQDVGDEYTPQIIE